MNRITNNNDTHIKGVITASGVIDSTVTGSGKTFENSDNGKIFHVSNDNDLTIPAWNTLDKGWTVGVVNMTGGVLTIKCSAADIVNGEQEIYNTIEYTGFYIYKSEVTDQFVAIGTLY